MATIEQNGDDQMLVFNRDEIERVGIEKGMNANFSVKKGLVSITLEKEITVAELQKFTFEIVENINKRPWISYTTEKKSA